MTSIVLATSNTAKRAQLRRLLEGLPLNPVEARPISVPETAADLAGNAALKAVAYSTGGLAIASDGGLTMPGLAGRWDPLLTQRQGRARLRELAVGLMDRRACWTEAAAVADRGRVLAAWTESGTEGLLAPEPWPATASEFWVWDVFWFPAVRKTWAALSLDERETVDVTWGRLRADVRAFFRGG